MKGMDIVYEGPTTDPILHARMCLLSSCNEPGCVCENAPAGWPYFVRPREQPERWIWIGTAYGDDVGEHPLDILDPHKWDRLIDHRVRLARVFYGLAWSIGGPWQETFEGQMSWATTCQMVIGAMPQDVIGKFDRDADDPQALEEIRAYMLPDIEKLFLASVMPAGGDMPGMTL